MTSLEIYSYLNAPDSWLTSSGFPFLFQETLGGGMPDVSQLSTALIPALTVTLKGPGLMEGPTDRTQNTLTDTKQQNFGCLSRGTCVVITKHPQIHSPVIRSSLVGYGAVVATSITELDTVHTQGALWQQSVPETKTASKDGSRDRRGEWRVCLPQGFLILLVILSYGEAIFSPCNRSTSFFFDFTR